MNIEQCNVAMLSTCFTFWRQFAAFFFYFFIFFIFFLFLKKNKKDGGATGGLSSQAQPDWVELEAALLPGFVPRVTRLSVSRLYMH